MKNNYDQPDLEDFDLDFDSPQKVEKGARLVEERLWVKLEKFGKKLSFARDVLALYQYLIDSRVSWHRKSIVVGALVYFIVPLDVIPDIAPFFGYLDDLGVITAVLKFLGSELIPYYED
ncbi:MAG: YkvA family protein [Bacteroidota bacterium]